MTPKYSFSKKNKCIIFVALGYVFLILVDYLYNTVVFSNETHTYEIFLSFIAVILSIHANSYISEN